MKRFGYVVIIFMLFYPICSENWIERAFEDYIEKNKHFIFHNDAVDIECLEGSFWLQKKVRFLGSLKNLCT